MEMHGFTIRMDLLLDGKPLTRLNWKKHHPNIISNGRLGFELWWDVPSELHPADRWVFRLMGTCLIDQNWMWGQLSVQTDSGMPLTYAMPWRCAILPYEMGKSVPGAVDRLDPGLYVDPNSTLAAEWGWSGQRSVTCVSYVQGVVDK